MDRHHRLVLASVWRCNDQTRLILKIAPPDLTILFFISDLLSRFIIELERYSHSSQESETFI